MISKKVHDELMSVRRVQHFLPVSPSTECGWTPHERQTFWSALDHYPRGPWTVIAEYIGTKSTRQAMTHAQKLRQKLKRWETRLHRNPKARNLLNEITTISATSAAATMEMKILVSVPKSQVLTESSGHGSLSATLKSVSPRPEMCQVANVGSAADDDERLPHEHKSFTANSTDFVAYQGVGTRERSIINDGLVHTPQYLQMLFESHTPVASAGFPVTTVIPVDVGETKHDSGSSTILHPISYASMPTTSLLDELADALWE